jgi:hypothetical protein
MLVGCGTPVEDGLLIRTADPNLSFFVPVAEMVPLPTVTPGPDAVVPEEEVGVTEPEPPTVPPCLDIKANISSSGEKIYHLPDGAYYDQVKIDESKGEAFFCDVESAEAAGFRASSR